MKSVACCGFEMHSIEHRRGNMSIGNRWTERKQNEYIGNIKPRLQPKIVIWKQWNAIWNTLFPMTSHCFLWRNFVSNFISMFPIYFFFVFNRHCFQCMFPNYIIKKALEKISKQVLEKNSCDILFFLGDFLFGNRIFGLVIHLWVLIYYKINNK